MLLKFKVIKSGFSYNGNNLLVGQVFEGEDKNEKFLEKNKYRKGKVQLINWN